MSEMPAESEKAKIVITRPHAGRQDRRRNYWAQIDGRRHGTIAVGQTAEYEVAPGKHAVGVRIDWAGSPTHEVDLAAGEVCRLSVVPRRPARPWGGLNSGAWVTFVLLVRPSTYLELVSSS